MRSVSFKWWKLPNDILTNWALLELIYSCFIACIIVYRKYWIHVKHNNFSVRVSITTTTTTATAAAATIKHCLIYILEARCSSSQVFRLHFLSMQSQFYLSFVLCLLFMRCCLCVSVHVRDGLCVTVFALLIDLV